VNRKLPQELPCSCGKTATWRRVSNQYIWTCWRCMKKSKYQRTLVLAAESFLWRTKVPWVFVYRERRWLGR
jgi:hypothetical protein